MILVRIRKKAFSLIEVVVSLAIVSIIMILFFNIITAIISTAIKTNARSAAREEIAVIASLIRQDIRNANIVTECGGEQFPNSCSMVTSNEKITWRPCDDNEKLLCRYTGEDIISYQMADTLEIDTFSFDVGFGDDIDTTKQNIIFNLSANHANEDLEINNILSNNTISTRNYDFAVASEENLIQCGNGIKERGEICDDGNGIDNDSCSNACIIPCPYPEGVSSVYSTSGGFCGAHDGVISVSPVQRFCNSTTNELKSITITSSDPDGLDDILVISQSNVAGISYSGGRYIIPEKHILVAPTGGSINGSEKNFAIRRANGSLTNFITCSDEHVCSGGNFRDAGYSVIDFKGSVSNASLQNLGILNDLNLVNYKLTHMGAGCGHALGITLRGNY